MKCPNIFVDTSYAVYVTAFSTWEWYKGEFDPFIVEGESFDAIKEPEFRNEFEKRFKFNIFSNIQRLVPLYIKSKVYFAVDNKRDDLWRKVIFPQYKLKRHKKKRELNTRSVFDVVNDFILPKYQDDDMHVLKCDFAEADDVIGVCVKINQDQENIIIANDSDLCQLLMYPNVTIVNLRGEQLTIEAKIKKLNIDDDRITPSQYLLMKIYNGDTADEIPPIHVRCGPKTAYKYLKDTNLLREALEKHPQAKENLQRNRRLIDLRRIPKEVEDDIINTWNNLN